MNIQNKKVSYFDSTSHNQTAKIYYVIFNDFDDLTITINNELVDIVHADLCYDLAYTKKEIYELISEKSQKQKYGLVAEFFSHLVLRNLGYNQRCLYKNLEESSMKKGFDGLYTHCGEFWLVESKAAYTNVTHSDKIDEAISDLKTKVETKQKNNPWLNAVNHIYAIKSKKQNIKLQDQIKKLSIEYIKGIKHSISEFNIIPVSTLFIKNPQSLNKIVEDIKNLINGKTYKNIIVICIDNYIFEEFITYLRK